MVIMVSSPVWQWAALFGLDVADLRGSISLGILKPLVKIGGKANPIDAVTKGRQHTKHTMNRLRRLGPRSSAAASTVFTVLFKLIFFVLGGGTFRHFFCTV